MKSNIKNIEAIINKFIETHGEESYYTKGIKQKVYKWIENSKDLDVRNILLELFDNFKIFSKIEIKDIMREQLIQCLVQVDIDYTNICHLPSKENIYNSSSELIPLIREIDREDDNKYIYKDTIVHGISEVESDIEYILFFDDIAGTGDTIITFIEEYIDSIRSKTIYINLIVITKVAKTKIEEFKEKNPELKIIINYKYEYDKSFLYMEKLDESHKDKLYKFEESVWGRNNRNILGFKDSQLIIGFDHNVPNNTISSFWLGEAMLRKRTNWNPLFYRYTPRKRPKKRIKDQNMNVTKIGG